MKVFISHTFADDDQELSQTLQKTLAEKDIEGYLAEKKQEYDLLIRDKIRDEIEKSDYIVGIVTNKARESASVNQELGYALRAGVRMIIMLEKEAKNGVLTHGMEVEEFTREKFQESCKKILNYIVTKGPRKKISDEDKKWLIDNVYRPCYNSIINAYKTRDFITYTPGNKWDELEAYAKLKTEEDMVKLLDQYSTDLNKWQLMWNDFQNNFQNKREDLAKIVKLAFEKTNLLDDTGRINSLEGGVWDIAGWLHNCSDVLFNENIKTEEELYTILRDDAIRRWGRFTEMLDKWKKEKPEIYSEILKVIPDLIRNLGAKYSYSQMNVQRQVLKEIIEKLTFALEQKLR